MPEHLFLLLVPQQMFFFQSPAGNYLLEILLAAFQHSSSPVRFQAMFQSTRFDKHKTRLGLILVRTNCDSSYGVSFRASRSPEMLVSREQSRSIFKVLPPLTRPCGVGCTIQGLGRAGLHMNERLFLLRGGLS